MCSGDESRCLILDLRYHFLTNTIAFLVFSHFPKAFPMFTARSRSNFFLINLIIKFNCIPAVCIASGLIANVVSVQWTRSTLFWSNSQQTYLHVDSSRCTWKRSDGFYRLELFRDCTSDWFMPKILTYACLCTSFHDLYHSVQSVTWRSVQRSICWFRIFARLWHIQDCGLRSLPLTNDGIPCGSRMHKGKRGTGIKKPAWRSCKDDCSGLRSVRAKNHFFASVDVLGRLHVRLPLRIFWNFFTGGCLPILPI